MILLVSRHVWALVVYLFRYKPRLRKIIPTLRG